MCVYVCVCTVTLSKFASFMKDAVAERLISNTNAEVLSGLVWPNSTYCSGDEEQLIDCLAFLEYRFQKCFGKVHAGVRCGIKKGTFLHTHTRIICIPTLNKKLWCNFKNSGRLPSLALPTFSSRRSRSRITNVRLWGMPPRGNRTCNA